MNDDESAHDGGDRQEIGGGGRDEGNGVMSR